MATKLMLHALILDSPAHREWTVCISALNSSMKQQHGYKASATVEANKAERYLRRYSRFMDYATMRDSQFPIGSGIVESTCKQIVSERFKLSGMRWKHEGAQATMTLRCILLSGIWNAVYNTAILENRQVSMNLWLFDNSLT